MKILIIGASGLIGGYLFKEFSSLGEVKGTSFPLQLKEYPRLDIRNKIELKNIFQSFHPNIVLCPAAISDVEYCENNPDEAREVNVQGMFNVIKETKDNFSKLVFFSSEYIFNGENGPYSETDTPSPINEYGRQKMEVEGIMQKELNDFLIIRTTVVYGWEKEGKNFVMQVLKKNSEDNPIKVPKDQLSSPTYAGNLAYTVRELIKAKKSGIFNVVGNQLMSRYEFSQLICKVFSLNQGLIRPVFTHELGQSAKRPLKAGLKIDKIVKEVGAILISPLEGLMQMKAEENDGNFYIK